jgi:hypothetical protein
MIPDYEYHLLSTTTDDAWASALAGRVLEGYESLDLGLAWAETPPIDPATGKADPPEPWAERLTDLYRRALVRYARSFGLARYDPGVLSSRERVLQCAAETKRLRETAGRLRAEAKTLRLAASQARELSRQRRHRL